MQTNGCVFSPAVHAKQSIRQWVHLKFDPPEPQLYNGIDLTQEAVVSVPDAPAHGRPRQGIRGTSHYSLTDFSPRRVGEHRTPKMVIFAELPKFLVSRQDTSSFHAYVKHMRKSKVRVPVHYRPHGLAVMSPHVSERVLSPPADAGHVSSLQPVDRTHTMIEHDGHHLTTALLRPPGFIHVARPRRPAELSQHILRRRLARRHLPPPALLSSTPVQDNLVGGPC